MKQCNQVSSILSILLIAVIFGGFSSNAVAQEVITGQVTAEQTGESLPGVNISVDGTNIGTSTDSDGQYSLTVPSLRDTLRFSFIGYETREIPINGRTSIDIVMQSQAISGEEVTVVAYGEQSTETVTSSVSSVSSEEISKVPSASLGNALTGQATGLQIIQSSGQPGQTDPSIYLRGVSSLSAGDSQPIFVLDGVIVRDSRSITQLDPDIVESVNVLKDASATAVYGVEGANGAVVVETKRGQQGSMQISLNTSAGFQTPTVIQDYANSYETATAYNQAQLTDGVNPDRLRFSDTAIEAFRTGSDPLIYPDVDWRNYLINKTAFQSRTNVNISGGTEDVQYMVAGGYLKQDGFFKTFESDFDFNPTYDRYNFQSNLDISVTPTTQLAVTASGRMGARVEMRTPGALWQQIYHSPPYAGAGLVDGKLVTSSNRYISGPKRDSFQRYYGQGYNQHNKTQLNLHLTGTQDLGVITEGLEFSLKGAYNVYFTRRKFRNSTSAYYEPYYRTDVDNSASGDSTVVFQKHGTDDILGTNNEYGKDRDWYVEARLNYSQNFGSHNIKGLLMYNQRKRYYPNQNRGIPRGLVSSVARFNYNYDRRYLLEVSAGYNGSENFAKGNRFGLFPAASAGWVVTNEPYMPDIPFLDFLKFRASYGIVGNDSGIGRFLYLQDQYNTNSGGYNFGNDVPQDKPGTSEGSLGNAGIQWETSEKQNYGVNMRLFDKKFDVSFDYFKEIRTNILSTRNTVPSFVAANLPAANLGEVENKGYELKVTWQQQLGDFFYSIGGNMSFARNKILYMDEVPRNEPYQRRTGESVGQPFGYKFDGFYTEEEIGQLGSELPDPSYSVKAGYIKYKDLNGDGVIDEDDTAPIGYPQHSPEYTFGSNMQFRYKNVDLSMTWAAATNVSEMLVFAPYRIPFGATGDRTIMQWQYEGQWTPEKGQDATYPRLSLNANGLRNSHNSDFWLRDASYLRLKNLEIGYNFGADFLQKLNLKKMRVYANGYNLLTFSKMMDELTIDPEQPAQAFPSNYPVMEVYNFGVQLDF